MSLNAIAGIAIGREIVLLWQSFSQYLSW